MSNDLLSTRDSKNVNLFCKLRAFHKQMRSQSEGVELFACEIVDKFVLSVEGGTAFELENDVLWFSGDKR